MGEKVFSFEEASKHNNPDDCWLIIDGKVYDVTGFLDVHPGGKEPLLNISGEDATLDFEDIGHSDEAEELMKDFLVGKIEAYTRPKMKTSLSEHVDASSSHDSTSELLLYAMPPFILAAAFLLRYYNSNNNNNNDTI